MYKAHSQRILDSVVRANFQEVYNPKSLRFIIYTHMDHGIQVQLV